MPMPTPNGAGPPWLYLRHEAGGTVVLGAPCAGAERPIREAPHAQLFIHLFIRTSLNSIIHKLFFLRIMPVIRPKTIPPKSNVRAADTSAYGTCLNTAAARSPFYPPVAGSFCKLQGGALIALASLC
eukprot:1136787-Pelagomonas_calceolata.AAC.1